MKLWTGRLLATAAALLLVAAPVHAQDADHSVSFDGFGFTFSEELGSSVNVSTLIGDDPAEGPFGARPPSTRFSLYAASRAPRAGGQLGAVELYQVEDLTGFDYASSELEALNGLLTDRPDLDPAADGSPLSLPMLEDVGAAQAIRFLPTYVDTDQLSGIVFVTVFLQDSYPFAADSFTAIFQGISADGTTVITASIPLTVSVFPEEVTAAQIDRVFQPGGWERYLRQSLRKLRQAPEEAFSPSIGAIGAMIDSMTFSAPPEIEPVSAPGAG